MLTRILIVEDESITAEDLRDILTEWGYAVVDVVASGAEALASAERLSPDPALMDNRNKGPLDGTETARQPRERFNIPVIYLTAQTDRATVGNAKMAEPLGYIAKPFQQSQLKAVIETALHKRRSELEG